MQEERKAGKELPAFLTSWVPQRFLSANLIEMALGTPFALRYGTIRTRAAGTLFERRGRRGCHETEDGRRRDRGFLRQEARLGPRHRHPRRNRADGRNRSQRPDPGHPG